MTWPVTFGNVHSEPPAVLAQEATQRAAALRDTFALLAYQIQTQVVTAVLTAIGFTPAQIAQLLALVQGAEAFLSNPIGYIQKYVPSSVPGIPGLSLPPQTGVPPLGPVDGLFSALSGGLQGLLPAFIDNHDGTLTTIGNQVVSNGDGTLTIAVNAGTSLLNNVIDNADGTLMSVATALHSKIQSFGTHSAAINDLNTALNTAGLSHPGQLVTALQGVIPAILDNGDGTLTTLSSQITHNFDGTYTYVAQQVQQGAANLNGLIDNLDGTLMPFYHSVSQTVNNTLGGLLHAFTGSPVAGVTNTQAQQAQVVTAAGLIQQRLATIGNGAEEQVDVEWSAFTNGAVPGTFTGFTNSGTAPTVSGGVLTVTGSALSHDYYYNGTSTLTDYQQITGVWPTLIQGSAFSVPSLFGRVSAAGTTFVQAEYTTGSQWTLVGFVSSSIVMSVTFTDTFTTGATYSLVCGDPTTTNPYKFQILKNGNPLPLASVTTGDTSQPAGQLFYTDTSHATTVGGSNRLCGMGFDVGAGSNGTISMSSFQFQDTTQSQPSVLVTTLETTASASYTDLATISDQVVVNIGTSGLADVRIYCSGSSGGAMSFALSGANTQAATDANAVSFGTAFNGGATHLLAGLAPGLTTFKLKYRSTAGTVSFSNRRIGVVAL